MLFLLPIMLPRSYGPPIQPIVMTKQMLALFQENAAFVSSLERLT